MRMFIVPMKFVFGFMSGLYVARYLNCNRVASPRNRALRARWVGVAYIDCHYVRSRRGNEAESLVIEESASSRRRLRKLSMTRKVFLPVASLFLWLWMGAMCSYAAITNGLVGYLAFDGNLNAGAGTTKNGAIYTGGATHGPRYKAGV